MLIAVVVLGVAGVAGAAGPMALTRTGDLYSVATVDNQVVVTARYADGTVSELFVPQSSAAVEDSLQVGVDEATGSVFVAWQKLHGLDAKVRFAALVGGTWVGPRTLAGNDGSSARYPQLLVHRAQSEVVEAGGDDSDGEPFTSVLETTFVNVVWWSQQFEGDTGSAFHLSIPLNSEGIPLFGLSRESMLSDLLPYGMLCVEIAAVDSLLHPKFFVDPQSGNPHVFLTDFESCAFHIMELQPEVVENEASDKRRRQIIILRHAQTVTIRPDLPLAASKFSVGRDLSIVAHWDRDETLIEYVTMDRSGVSDYKTLEIGPTLSHEQAVELIRGLAN
jgi:hypothetical protein